MSTVYKAEDITTIQATIRNEGIDPIQGQPSCYTLIKTSTNRVKEQNKLNVNTEYLA